VELLISTSVSLAGTMLWKMFAIWDTLDPTSLDDFFSSITGSLYNSYTNQTEKMANQCMQHHSEIV
jgi:hypothetical protein